MQFSFAVLIYYQCYKLDRCFIMAYFDKLFEHGVNQDPLHCIFVLVCNGNCRVRFQLMSSGKTSKINGFTDPSIANSRAIIDLVDTCKPGCVNYDLVKAGHTEQVGALTLS